MRARHIRILRFCRAMLALLVAVNLVFAWLRATAWHSPGWSVAAAVTAVGACGMIAYSTKALHLLGWRRVLGLADLLGVTWILLAGHDERARLRKAVARRRRRPMMLPADVMERDIWGQAFEHAGAVVPGISAANYRQPSTGPPMRLPSAAMMQTARDLPKPPVSVSVRACCGTTPGTGCLKACPGVTVATITPGTVGLWEIFVPPPVR